MKWLLIMGCIYAGCLWTGNGSSVHGFQDSVDDQRVPTGQVLTPAGKALRVEGRPNDLVLNANRTRLFVKSHRSLLVVKVPELTVLQSLPLPGGASLKGILVDDNGQVLVTNSGRQLHVYAPIQDGGDYELSRSIDLPENSFPCGLCFGDDQQRVYVCLSKTNELAEVNVSTGKVLRTFPVGIAPFDVEYQSQSGKLLVSNLGGRRATDDDSTAASAGTPTPVDKRGIANTGTVTQIDLRTGKAEQEIGVGLHPSELVLLKHQQALVTNSNDDSFSLLSQGIVRQQIVARPLKDLPFGSMPDAACLSSDGQKLFVGLAGNNAVAVYDVPQDVEVSWPDKSAERLIPTAWYPVSLACDEQFLYVANLKGIGSRSRPRAAAQGMNSHDHQGLIQQVPLKDVLEDQWAQWSSQVIQQARLLPVERVERTRIEGVDPVPVPEKLGQPSVFEHVIYVIKENRTYDQVFGDIEEGRGDPTLCTFPEKLTPNHHALARQFGLLDNYYCNGVLSADGHSWATEGNVTPYLERAFGGFSRSYTFGDDPITYSSSGFIWDQVLGAGLSFRNYGEMDYAKPPEGMAYQEIWSAFQEGKEIEFQQNIGIERLRRYSAPDYPGWNMTIPDVLRVQRFLDEFHPMVEENRLPNLMIVYLPQDHLGGGVTSQAHMADNDLALGRLVEAVSHSSVWEKTLIVVNEDDPQNGYDHIDGHRSLCLMISAYSRPGVNHGFYNQTSVLRTILHVLGIPPMNQNVARSGLMRDCFGDQPDQVPFEAREVSVPLNQRPAAVEKQGQRERHWRSILKTVPIARTGMKTETDEDNLNRFIWHETQGWETPYPADWAGAHGRGLKSLGLTHDPDAEQE